MPPPKIQLTLTKYQKDRTHPTIRTHTRANQLCKLLYCIHRWVEDKWRVWVFSGLAERQTSIPHQKCQQLHMWRHCHQEFFTHMYHHRTQSSARFAIMFIIHDGHIYTRLTDSRNTKKEPTQLHNQDRTSYLYGQRHHGQLRSRQGRQLTRRERKGGPHKFSHWTDTHNTHPSINKKNTATLSLLWDCASLGSPHHTRLPTVGPPTTNM